MLKRGDTVQVVNPNHLDLGRKGVIARVEGDNDPWYTVIFGHTDDFDTFRQQELKRVKTAK